MTNIPLGIKKMNYVIYCPFDFSYSKKHLTNIYGPIIEAEALNLYLWLIDEADFQLQLPGIKSPIDRILKYFDISLDKFATIREKLEAIDLISTYLEENSDKKIFHIEIKEPLNWIKFNSNEKLRHLLINKIGMSEYERISLVFSGKRIPEKVSNISATFNIVFNNEKLDQIMEFNFEELHNLLSFDLQKPIVISNEAKLIIDGYFKIYNLSLQEIKCCVNNSILQLPNDNIYQIDTNRLREQFKTLINSTPNIQTFKYIKIIRDIKLFDNTIENSKKEMILEDYKNINAEHYLSSIQKSSLTNEQIKTIKELRNFSHLSDEIINILTDFMLFKTYGKYNKKYLNKLANTINCLSYIDLEQVLLHLQNAYQNKYYKNSFKRKETIISENVIKDKLIQQVNVDLLNGSNDINLNEAFNLENIYDSSK